MNELYPNPPKIMKTKNYEKFKFLKWNRDINDSNLKKLINENNKNFQLHKFPILVDSNNFIIDGQHRFFASKELGSPIYYIKEESSATFDDITSVNSAGRRHTLRDMVEMAAKAGVKSCIKVLEIYEETNHFFDLGSITRLLMGNKSNSGNATVVMRKGEGFKIVDEEICLEVLRSLQASNLMDANQLKVILALKLISKNTGIKPEKIIKRIMHNKEKWKKTATTNQCAELILDVYNFRLGESNKIFISKWTKQ